MKLFICYLVLALLLQITIVANSKKVEKYDLAIKNVTVFDSKSKKVLPSKTILISGNKIASVVDATQKFKARKTIKGKGRLVIPGFVDTHTHILQTYGAREFGGPNIVGNEVIEVYKKLIARQYLAKGITTIVDMAQPEGWIESSLNLQKNPSPKFPNLFINGSSTISDLKWNRNVPLHHEVIADAEDGKKKVRKYAKLGIKHMKLYWKLEAADMKAVIDEAKKYDITLNAHVDQSIVTIPQAIDLGVNNFEHFFTVVPSVLTYRQESKKFNKKFGLDNRGNIDIFAANMVFYFKYIKDNPELHNKLIGLFTKMAENKVSISTALNVLASAVERSHTFSTFDSMPPRITPQTDYSQKQKQQLSEAFDAMMKYMKIAHEKGVKLRIGTDTRYGGKAFFSELKLFSEAGFSTEDILQIATINGAEAMKIDDKFGSIEIGKQADLVIFDKNPFDDHRNFDARKTVVKDGKIFQAEKSIAYSLVKRIENKGLKSGLKWFRKHKRSGKYGEVDAAELNEIGYQLLAKGKIKDGIAVYKLAAEHSTPKSKVYNDLSENNLNAFGYHLLGKNQNGDAIEIFKYNTQKYPKSSNVYDSLGEAYLGSKNNQLALTNYKKAVELNPENFNAVQIVNELEGKEVKVDIALLDSYVGKYEFRPDTIWNIARDGKKLTFQETGQNLFKLEAISNTTFVIRRANVSILFEKDSSGIVTGLVFNQAGRPLKAKRLRSTKTETAAEPSDSISYRETKLPDDPTKLWLSNGNPESNTVVIFCQGGPDDTLTFAEHGRTRLRYLPKYNEYNIAYLHQAQTFNKTVFRYKTEFTKEMAEKEVAITVEILDQAVKYFKKKNKKVVVIGNSYGAYVITNYLANKKSLADKYVIIAGRIDDSPEIVEQHGKGLNGGYDETGKMFVPTKTDPNKLSEAARKKYRVKQLLKWAIGKPRYSKLLADKDLSNVVYFYATNDRNVGRLTEKEIKFLQSIKVTVYPTAKGHSNVFYSFIDAIMEGKLKL